MPVSDVNDETVLSARKQPAPEPVSDETVLSSRKPLVPEPLDDRTVISTRGAQPIAEETVLSTRGASSAAEPVVDETVLSARNVAAPTATPVPEPVIVPEPEPEPEPFVGTTQVVDPGEAAQQNQTFGPRDIPEQIERERKFDAPTVTKVGKSADELWEINKKRVQRRSTKVIVSLIVSGVAIVALVIIGVVVLVGQS
jgi:hypothetical protein